MKKGIDELSDNLIFENGGIIVNKELDKINKVVFTSGKTIVRIKGGIGFKDYDGI